MAKPRKSQPATSAGASMAASAPISNPFAAFSGGLDADPTSTSTTPTATSSTMDGTSDVAWLNNLSDAVPAQLAVLLRSVGKKKKSVVSKVKAFDDLVAFLDANPSAAEHLVHVLPGFLNRFFLDPEKRVRRIVFELLLRVVDTHKKALAPYLNDLIAPWILARFDADVGELAVASFEATFSQSKRAAVIAHCKAILVARIRELLCEKSPTTLSDPRFTSEHEMNAVFTRATVSAIKSVFFLKGYFDTSAIADDVRLARNIQSEFPAIRSAMTDWTLNLIADQKPVPWKSELLNAALTETNPRVAAEMWHAVLATLQQDKEWAAALHKAQLSRPLGDALKSTTTPVSTLEALPVIVNTTTASIPMLIKANAHGLKQGLPSRDVVRARWMLHRDLLVILRSRQGEWKELYLEWTKDFVLGASWCRDDERHLGPGAEALSFAPLLSSCEPELVQLLGTSIATVLPARATAIASPLGPGSLASLCSALCDQLAESFSHNAFLLASAVGSPLADISGPLFAAAMTDCSACAEAAVKQSSALDVALVHEAIVNSSYTIPPLLDALPSPPRSSSFLTLYLLDHHDNAALVKSALRGHVDATQLIQLIIDPSLSPDVACNIACCMGTVRDAQLAKIVLQSATDGQWEQVTLALDRQVADDLVVQALMDHTRVSPDSFALIFTRLGSLVELLASVSVLALLESTGVPSAELQRAAFVDLYATTDPTSQTPSSADRGAVLAKLCRVDWSALPLNLKYEPVLRLICLLGAQAPASVAALILSESVLSVLYDSLSSQETAPSTMAVYSLYWLATKSVPTVKWLLPHLQEHADVGSSSRRLLAAVIAAVSSKFDSVLLDQYYEQWARKAHVDLSYLMLAVASNIRLSSPQFSAVFDTYVADQDDAVTMPVRVTVAWALQRALPISLSDQYAWLLIDVEVPEDNWYAGALIDRIFSLVPRFALDADEAELFFSKAIEIWATFEHPSPILCEFVSSAPASAVAESILWSKLWHSDVAVVVAGFDIARRLIALRVQELSLQLEVSRETLSISGELQIPAALLDLAKNVPNADPTREISYLLTWILVLSHLSSATLQLKTFFLESIDVDQLIAFVADIFGHADAQKLDIWDVTSMAPSAIAQTGTSQQDTEQAVVLLAMHVYHQVLAFCPTHARNWFNRCRDRRLSGELEKLTERMFSPALIDKELEAAKEDVQDLTVQVQKSSQGASVTATYHLDDAKLELVLTLPPQYPLRQVAIEGGEHSVVGERVWRAWVLSCKSILAVQNASIADCLRAFANNLSAFLRDVNDPCAICYSIVGVTCKTLPNKPCRTCKQKFHSSCLLAWFKSSSGAQGSTCPLCRSVW
ncbi:hypothetical protein BC828DRAFT_369465 [Blastocladiella britannica]|nr:hypothetical protein BC828DRAFT_369465 [Blastocladiella britannica]